ncbi:TldD/PmbA family protein [Algoriphagus aquimarinus]|uniref:Predicted Zn-dependent protease or its inactivated homolog n=1 Tax=Algoriphagus aquimarinus TaxID=237018 RepID=A0A1I0XK09_9BACT|nr:TldD/PmbA family protein [Algoriphagus aquimarinus]SFB00766.1 Predicted Zn-dependent protease or its inactivated homolog [Algoriphagus aquimarinus]|tara:strand:+ start:198622 stop:199953 length:1332 start_codon:yes stop_codon:yes gene_type:complete
MAILTKEEAKKIIDKVLSYSKADEMEVSIFGGKTGNIRYARNTVNTSGETNEIRLSVNSVFGKKVGSSSTNELDDASLKKVVARAEEIAMLAPENPEYMPMLGPQVYPETATFSPATDKITPDFRAQLAMDSIEVTSTGDLTAAGYLEDFSGFVASGNSKGQFGYNTSTSVDFSITVRTTDGTGSGYAIRDFNDVNLLNSKEVTSIAMQKAQASANAQAIEPGKYTVILEPTAAGDLLSLLTRGFDARSADEGRSYMSKKGGGTRLGEKLFDERVSIISDPFNTEIPTSPWDGDGLPKQKTTWVENGVVKNLSYSRYWAEKQGVTPLSGAGGFGGGGFIFSGGDESIADMIKSTERGVLVTRFWYIRAVDPQTLLFTGLTRDGTFYIENGQIKFPVKNFRFNESPIIMLNNIESMGKPQRVGGSLIPPMKIRDFTFTSLSDAV